MKLLAPNYYAHFACIADQCRHSCCIGWEIDVDDASLERYRHVPGELGKRLQETIAEEDGNAHFRLDEQERCPFLDQRGLCELIVHLGSDSLCQICADHPRYRSFFTGHTEIGLGLCCEAAARLILTWPSKVELVVLEDDPAPEPSTPEENAVLRWREHVTAMAQDSTQPIGSRAEAILEQSGVPLPDMQDTLVLCKS